MVERLNAGARPGCAVVPDRRLLDGSASAFPGTLAAPSRDRAHVRGASRTVVTPALRTAGLLLATVLFVAVPPVAPTPPSPETVVDTLPTPQWQQAGRWWVADLPAASVSVSADLGRVPGARVEVRASDGHDHASWRPLPLVPEHAPDPRTAEASAVATGVTDPVWVGRGSAAQVRTDAANPHDLRLIVASLRGRVGGGVTPPAGVPAAEALPVWPPIVPRTVWDPRGECQPGQGVELAGGVRRIFIHHTAVFPHYRPGEADDIVRTICLQHTHARGFGDIGYNFLIDAYGTIYQGRAGGILQAVVGAHASGFNRGSAGIALIGDHETDPVPEAARRSLDRLVAWLMDLHDLDPQAVTPHVSTGGSSRFPEGAAVPLPTILGHRDTAVNTLCPGEHLYRYVTGAGGGPGALAVHAEALVRRPPGPGLGRAAAAAAVGELVRELPAGPLGRVVGRLIAGVDGRASWSQGRSG